MAERMSPLGELYISDVNLSSSSHFELAQSNATDHQQFRTDFQIVLSSLFRAEVKKNKKILKYI